MARGVKVFSLLIFFSAIIFIPQISSEHSFNVDKTSDKSETRVYVEVRSEQKDVVKKSTLLFSGDIMLSRSVGDKIKKTGDWRWPFLKISDITSGADLFFGNLEGPISDGGVDMKSVYSFKADSRVADGLKYAGFDVLSVANNHMGDWGTEAFDDTLEILDENNIDFIGGGKNNKEAYDFKIKEVNGIRFAFLGYTALSARHIWADDDASGVALLDVDKLKEGIKKAREKSDAVIVSIHFGEEYQIASNKYQQSIARKAIDAGASLVIGHHPHVVQEIEKYKDGYIAYSLGNFVFDQLFSKETMEGMLLKVVFDGGAIKNVEPIKTVISRDFQVGVAP